MNVQKEILEDAKINKEHPFHVAWEQGIIVCPEGHTGWDDRTFRKKECQSEAEGCTARQGGTGRSDVRIGLAEYAPPESYDPRYLPYR